MNNELTFKDIKNLDYPDMLPFNYVLVDLLYKKLIDVNTIMVLYSEAIEKENHLNKMKFEEAMVNICQLLSKNFTGDSKKEAIKRSIHTYNLTNSLARNIYNAEYEYTEEDKKKWDEFCKRMYGADFNDKDS